MATISAILSCPIRRGRPGLGLSCSPSMSYSAYCFRQRQTVYSEPNLLSEMALLFRPSAAANTISALRTNFCGVVGLLFHLNNICLCSSVSSMLYAFLAMLLSWHGETYFSTYFTDWILGCKQVRWRKRLQLGYSQLPCMS